MPWVQNISCNHYFREREWNFLRENSRLLLPKLLILNTLKWNLSNGGKQSNVLLCKAEYVVKSLCTRCAVYHDFLQCWTRMRYVIFQLLHSYLTVTSHLQRPKKSILLLFDSTEFKYSTQCFQKKNSRIREILIFEIFFPVASIYPTRLAYF